MASRSPAKKKEQALARKEQEFRELILKANRAEPLGGGSFGGDDGRAGRPLPAEVGRASSRAGSPGASPHKRSGAHGATRPTDEFFHGKQGNRLVVVGPINLPVGRLFVEEVITEFRKRGASHVDVPTFEFEMGLFPAVLDEAKQKGIDLAPKTIPPEVFDKRAVERGQVRFQDVAYIEVTPRFGTVGRASSRAGSSGASPHRSDDSLTLSVELTDFSVYCSQGLVDAIAADLKVGKSEVVCEQGQLLKVSKDKQGIITRDVLTKKNGPTGWITGRWISTTRAGRKSSKSRSGWGWRASCPVWSRPTRASSLISRNAGRALTSLRTNGKASAPAKTATWN